LAVPDDPHSPADPHLAPGSARANRALGAFLGLAVGDALGATVEFRFRPWPGRTTGYIVHTVSTVFDGFFNTGSYKDCLVRVVDRGGDADTAGALAGQLAGALYGVEGIPRRWLRRLDPAVRQTIEQQTRHLLELSSPRA
jgi:ADP-ribosyl-[dinitrogen reductase] hydrolase